MIRMKIKDICDLQNGRAFKPSDWGTAGLPIIRIQNLNDERAPFNYYGGKYNLAQEVDNGDLLFSWSGTPGTSFGAFLWNRGKGVLNQHIFKVIPKVEVDKTYLMYALNGNISTIISKAHGGVGLQHITKKELDEIEIQMVSISRQKKIVEILEKISLLIFLRKQQLAKLDEVVKARFVEMFENVTEENALENLCHFIDYRGKTPEKSDSGLPFITAKNIRMHYMSFDTQEFISKENYDKVMTRGIPKVGDVVFTTEAPLGNVCRIPQFDTDFYIGQRIITMQTKLLNPVYLEYALSSDDFKRKLVGKSSGSTVTGIRSKLLGKLTIPVPSKGLQNQFAAFVARVDQQKQTVQQSLEKLELMKKALMQEYFG